MTAYLGNFGSGRDVTDYLEDYARVLGKLPVFLSGVNIGMPSVGATHVFWDDGNDPLVLTVNNGAGYADSATSIVVDSVTGLAVGATLRPAGELEVMKVTAINTGTKTLTVTRSFGAAAAVALTDNQELQVLSHGTKEGDGGTASASAAGDARTVYFQKFHRTYGVSGTRQAVAAHGVPAGEALAKEMEDAMEKIAYEMNTACLYQGAGTVMSSSAEGYLAGAYEQMVTAGSLSTSVGGALEEEDINDAVRALSALGGTANAIVTNPRNIKTIAAAAATRLQWINNEQMQAGYAVLGMTSDVGARLTFYLDHNVDPSHAFIFDLNQMQLIPRRPMEVIPLGVTGDAQEEQIVTEMTFQFKNAGRTAYLLTGITA